MKRFLMLLAVASVVGALAMPAQAELWPIYNSTGPSGTIIGQFDFVETPGASNGLTKVDVILAEWAGVPISTLTGTWATRDVSEGIALRSATTWKTSTVATVLIDDETELPYLSAPTAPRSFMWMNTTVDDGAYFHFDRTLSTASGAPANYGLYSSFYGGWYETISDLNVVVGDKIATLYVTPGAKVSFLAGALPSPDSLGPFQPAFSANYVVPEPSTLALLGCGLMGLLAYAWRKRK